MATIKIATQGDNDRFYHGGIDATRGWTELDLDTLAPEGAQALIEYVGRFIRVHDEDQAAFQSWLGSQGRDLRYEDGRVVDPERERREREEQERAARGTQPGTAPRAASGTLPGQPPPRTPTPPRDDTQAGSFQTPPGATTDAAARERSSATTEPDRPSTKKPSPR